MEEHTKKLSTRTHTDSHTLCPCAAADDSSGDNDGGTTMLPHCTTPLCRSSPCRGFSPSTPLHAVQLVPAALPLASVVACPLALFGLGQHVVISCQNGALVRIAAVTPPPLKHLAGTITELSASSIIVRDGTRSLTCALAESSPSTAAFSLGGHADIVCADGELVAIVGAAGPLRKLTDTHTTVSGTSEPTPEVVTDATGLISALSSTSVTVDGLTCPIPAGSTAAVGVQCR